MADTSMVSESDENVDIDGKTRFQKVIQNLSQIATRFGAKFDFVLGPNGEHKHRYDTETADPVEDAAQRLDANDTPVYTAPNTHQTFEFERLPCVPEYDTESEVPQVRSGDDRYDTPYNPRAIVRFTANSSFTPGLYSYSVDQSAWVRIDKP